MSERRISTPRVLAGFAAGAAFVLAIYSWLLWPAWGAVLLVGGASAAVIVAVLGFPALLFLRKRGMLSVYAAAVLGGIFCMIPPLFLAITNAIEGVTPAALGSTEILFWLQYFLLPGIAGGIIGWIVAAGFRTQAQ